MPSHMVDRVVRMRMAIRAVTGSCGGWRSGSGHGRTEKSQHDKRAAERRRHNHT